jgi:hypothetical protein
MRSRLLAVLLVLSMTPATAELVESGVHLVAHGDLGHLLTADGHDAPFGGDEHGCTAVLHVCGCHASGSLPAVERLRPVHPVALRAAAARAPAEHLGLGNPPPPIRPPIA